MRWSIAASLIVLAVLAYSCTKREKQAGTTDGGRGHGGMVLRAALVPQGTKVRVDGKTADPVWRKAAELKVPLTGDGPAHVLLKAAYDGERIYLQAIWPDEEPSRNWFWRYLGEDRFEESRGEDAFALMLPPGGASAAFAEQGCAMSCHANDVAEDGDAPTVHRWLGDGGDFLDFWFWGAQTTAAHPQGRDLWLRHGDKQRLRGDGQPDGSDNLPNLSTEFMGPKYAPFRMKRTVGRFLMPGNVQELTRDTLLNRISEREGWEIARHIMRPRKGSRGDVTAHAVHHKGRAWVLEMSRALQTGNSDDVPLVPDPLVRPRFAIAVWNGTSGAAHARSGPIQLEFLTVP